MKEKATIFESQTHKLVLTKTNHVKGKSRQAHYISIRNWNNKAQCIITKDMIDAIISNYKKLENEDWI